MSKHFPGQRDDEEVIVLVRRHWIVWFVLIGQLLFFNLLPFVFYFIAVNIVGWNVSPDEPWFVIIVLILSFYYLAAWLMYFHQFVDYRLDVWILTDQRIISIEQQGLFDRVISEVNIVKLEDVTSELRGHLQTILDYGNVYIQTAGNRERFVFENIPHPEEIAKLVTRTNDLAIKLLPTHVAQQIKENRI